MRSRARQEPDQLDMFGGTESEEPMADEKNPEIESLKSQIANFEKAIGEEKSRYTKELEAAKAGFERQAKDLTATLFREAVRGRAVSEGLIDSEIVDYLPLDGLAFDGGKVTGLDQAISNLKSKHPKLFQQTGKVEAKAPETPKVEDSSALKEIEALKSKLADLEKKAGQTPIAAVGAAPKAEEPKPKNILDLSKEDYEKRKRAVREKLRMA